jgi:hypothetical protein
MNRNLRPHVIGFLIGFGIILLLTVLIRLVEIGLSLGWWP